MGSCKISSPNGFESLASPERSRGGSASGVLNVSAVGNCGCEDGGSGLIRKLESAMADCFPLAFSESRLDDD